MEVDKDLTVTINNADISIIEPIRAFLNQISPKSSLSVEHLYPNETALENMRLKVEDLCGALSDYANPELIEKEKGAWAITVKKKYILENFLCYGTC